jgi:AraC-like DNA-binding protein
VSNALLSVASGYVAVMGDASHVWLQRAPDAALRTFVDSYVGYASTGGVPGIHRGLPSTGLIVTVAFDSPVRVGWHGSQANPRDFWMVAGGPHAIPVDVHHRGRHHGMQASLSPAGARAIFGLPAAALAHELVELDALITLDHDALASASWDERFRMLDAALLAAAARTPSRYTVTRELQDVWSMIMHTDGTARVTDCANAVGWSRRRLLDRFTAEFGMTPKRTARVARLQASRRLLESGEPLAGTAAACGYADQAHLTREWVALAGSSPLRWLEAERTPTAAD